MSGTTARELRSIFTGFFAERDHTVVSSASLIPYDPTLLFTVAGMVPFKAYFTGTEPSPYKRATTVQKCVRAGGKQNDLDEIGRTRRHLSFFEMLGNFSFGDYFKDDAIAWAWELSTERLGFDPDRLWITVHLSDDEAADIWRDAVGVPAERIQRLDEDNFWRMGDTGPCGPCSEIFFDKGEAYGPGGGPAHGGDERYVEFWNLVFMQFEQQTDGSMVPLPKPSIDTGAGLERVLTLLQGVDSVFEIDEMARLVAKASELSGVRLGEGESSDVSLRIHAQHARTKAFLIGDGVLPSKNPRGHVLRRIMRRAIRHAYLLGVNSVVTPLLVDEVVDIMGHDYPELLGNHAFVRDVTEREEVRFRETLGRGSVLLDEALAGLEAGEPLGGGVTFLLHDTYGFPFEVTEEIARERGVELDSEGFEAELSQQRRRAREDFAARSTDAGDLSVYLEVLDEFGETEFVGRDRDESTGRVLAVTESGVVLDRTPFYAEAGGQIGDTGHLYLDGGEEALAVSDTTYVVAGLHLHHVEGAVGRLRPGQSVRAVIDGRRRAGIRRHHTGTHILHWALREVLGTHVKQQGSLVAPDRLRFDFSHYSGLSGEDIAAIEDVANAEILANPTCRHYETSMEEAKAAGAIAFFGDKYSDTVRVLEAGPNSIELCGGTHVRALGDIGPLKIISEGSIGSNIRRLEAVCGDIPIQRLRHTESRLAEAAGVLGVPPEDVVEGAGRWAGELKALRDEVKQLRRKAAGDRAGELAAAADDGLVVARIDGVDRNELRDLAVTVRDRDGVTGVVLATAPASGGVAFVSAVVPGAGWHASDLLGDALKLVGGGGGRNPDFATAGGKDATRLDEALDLVRRAAASQRTAG
ncbi:MAG: alanine--tRNA ligase [bacterium]|nr:alanine--tRNA ligase [bacterium]